MGSRLGYWYCGYQCQGAVRGLQQIIPEYALKYRKPTWSTNHMDEQDIWIEYEPGGAITFERVVFVGRVDSIRTKSIGRDWLVHWQIKTVSSQISIPDYMEQQKFSPHEMVYTDWMVHAVKAGILPDLPVYGTVLDVLRKVKKPDHPDTIKPPKELGEQGPRTSNEAWAKKTSEYNDRVIKWRERVSKKTLEYTEWRNAALHQENIHIRSEFRDEHINRLIIAAVRADHIKRGARAPLCSWGIACNAYHRPCEYVGVCNGTMRLDGLPFGDRTPDYVDKMGEDNGDLKSSLRSTQRFHNETSIHLGALFSEISESLDGQGSGHPTAAGYNGLGNIDEFHSKLLELIKKSLC